MKYSIEKVTTLIGARRYGNTEAQVSWLLTDSRSLCFPEETLFFALKTQRNDGHRYIQDLYNRGVRQFVVEQVPEAYETLYPQANFLRVPHTLAALQRLAERHRDEFSLPIVGITGSNGKTMVKEWLYQLLLPSQRIVRSPRSYNSQIGVPLSVWLYLRGRYLAAWRDDGPARYHPAHHRRAHLVRCRPSGKLPFDGREVHGETRTDARHRGDGVLF